tara:strand:- start:250 stop:522 length:273 start_codon:yes stop_codon:yes gene_type:complete
MSEVETEEPQVENEVEQEDEQQDEVMPNYVENFVDNVIDGNNSTAREDFDNAIAFKVTQTLDASKQQIASDIFNQETQDDSTQEDDESST